MAMTISIEKNVPLPVLPTGGRPGKYPWATMEVGDSFFIAGRDKRVIVPKWARTDDRKYVQHIGDDGVRVWRKA